MKYVYQYYPLPKDENTVNTTSDILGEMLKCQAWRFIDEWA